MDLNSLPYDLLSQILIRVPPKTLLQFRSVCRSWYSVISSSNFISSHLNHTHVNKNPKILFRRMIISQLNESYTLHNDDQNFNSIETLDFPFKSKNNCFVIVGCVNGVVCLWDYQSGNVLLWNPSIRKCYIVPENSADLFGSNYPPCRVFGFGFDSVTNDYKIVVRRFDIIDQSDNNQGETRVFSLSEKCWKKTGFLPCWTTQSRPRTVKGVIHRLTGENISFLWKLKLISFDLSTETCSEFACPEGVTTLSPSSESELSVFRDSLALIHTKNDRKCEIWVLKEEEEEEDDGGVVVKSSWVKSFALDLAASMFEQFVVGFTGSGLVVTVGRPGAVVEPIVEHPVIVNMELSNPEYHWHVEVCEQTLVLLREGVAVDDVAVAVFSRKLSNDKRLNAIPIQPQLHP